MCYSFFTEWAELTPLTFLPMTFLPMVFLPLWLWHFYLWQFYLWHFYLWHFYLWHFYLHSREYMKLVSYSRLSLNAGSIRLILEGVSEQWSLKAGGLLIQVVSNMKLWIYMKWLLPGFFFIFPMYILQKLSLLGLFKWRTVCQPFSTQSWVFLALQDESAWKTRWEKEKIFVTQHFLLLPQCFLPFQQVSNISAKLVC